jgi:methyl-accepting chemotaxis protein
MKISHRLLALSFLSALGLVAVAAVSAWSVTSIQTDLRALTTQAAPLQNKTYELQERTERAIGDLLKLSYSRGADEAKKSSAALQQQASQIEKLRGELRQLDPRGGGAGGLDLAATQREISAAVERRIGDDAAYRLEAEQARQALKQAEEAVASTRKAVQQIGVESGKAADRAQDSMRQLNATAKNILSAQTRLKELAIVVGDADLATNRFRLTPLKERAKATTDAIVRLEASGTDDPLKEARAAAASLFDGLARDGSGLLALRAAALAAKPDMRSDADAAYQKHRKALLAAADEQSTRLGAALDGIEVAASRQRQALEAALRVRNEPGGVVTTSEEVSLAIRDMVGQLRLLMLATGAADVKTAQADLGQAAQSLSTHMATMREGLQRMGRPQLAGEVEVALKAMASVTASIDKVGAAKASLLASETTMSAMLEKLKATAAEQAAQGAQQVQAIRQRQQQVSQGADDRVTSSLALIVGLSAVVIVITAAFSWVTVRTVTRRLDAAVVVAEQVGAGQLVRIDEVSGNDETARLMNALGRMVGTLERMVGNVTQAATQIHSGSAEINRGNEDLSTRTEQQAAQLQQTAASVQQLAGTVRSNADSARSASELAGRASEVAATGGRVVADVVRTMSDIQASSRRIGEIVGVIDGIAFQTNILALNAAVEAARAGEHGRGFAVVATEVRALAGKSAEAARQVKGIVDASVQQIEGGSTLVQGAGDTMREIVVQVDRVTQTIASIARASEEQASAVGSVDSAIGQLDQMTQQNAALAEQGSAATAQLREQAQGLTQAIAAFRVEAAAA